MPRSESVPRQDPLALWRASFSESRVHPRILLAVQSSPGEHVLRCFSRGTTSTSLSHGIRVRLLEICQVMDGEASQSERDLIIVRSLFVQGRDASRPLEYTNYEVVSLPTRLLTFSRCCLFLRWTEKLSADSPGPGVYSLPGQSLQRILGRNMYLICAGGACPGGICGGGVMMISVSACTMQWRMVASKASNLYAWRSPSRAALSQSGGGG